MKIKTVFLLTVLLLASCENVFHNDRLDYMWRLDKVEYADGHDFDGNACDVELKSRHWASFARDIVVLEKYGESDTCGVYGVFRENADSIFLDFSIWTDTASINLKLKSFGIGTVCSGFKLEMPDRKSLVLSGDRTNLYLTRW